MKFARFTAVVATALLVAGCAGGPKETAGTVVGATGGGLVGGALGSGSPGAVAAGAIIGGLIGNQIGGELDKADKQAAATAEYRALEYGRAGTPVAWRGRSGVYGEVVPGAAYQVNAYDCREYTHTIYISGEPQVARGTACRQQDGSWRTVT